jgi:hypothetical protein
MRAGETLVVLGETVTANATAHETTDALTAVEVVIPPGLGPPPHEHRSAIEVARHHGVEFVGPPTGGSP